MPRISTPSSSGFDETQIYRIDHYLGKETVQNILALRFANGIFEPVWNQHYVDHVQITVAEDIGVAPRSVLRGSRRHARHRPNHAMQVLCLTAMEPPVAFDAESVRGEGEGPQGGPSHPRGRGRELRGARAVREGLG